MGRGVHEVRYILSSVSKAVPSVAGSEVAPGEFVISPVQNPSPAALFLCHVQHIVPWFFYHRTCPMFVVRDVHDRRRRQAKVRAVLP